MTNRTLQSESRLYTFSQETKDQLRKFRLGTSRAKTPMAKICESHLTTQVLIFSICATTRRDKRSSLRTTGLAASLYGDVGVWSASSSGSHVKLAR
jgi:hypothetical protein